MAGGFSVSWQTYQKNICNGFSYMQQRGEFVDMTLAAEGHHVQVHKAVMSLVSPYIKDLITTTQCAHPVIFLNNVSHDTLNSILEYVYTGETLVPQHRFQEFINASRSLNISGLDILHSPLVVEDTDSRTFEMETGHQDDVEEIDDTYENAAESSQNKSDSTNSKIISQSDNYCTIGDMSTLNDDEPKFEVADSKEDRPGLQYTVSNQGNLQIILNRFMYFYRYQRKTNDVVWRCIDYYNNSTKCSALLITKNGKVIKRVRPHSHPFHDKRILKCTKNDKVYSMLNEAQRSAELIKKENKKESKK